MSKYLDLDTAAGFLERAMDLLEVSAPQRMLIEDMEYFNKLHKLRDDLNPYQEVPRIEEEDYEL